VLFRSEVSHLTTERESHLKQISSLQSEIQRLTALLSQSRDISSTSMSSQTEEIERLSDALSKAQRDVTRLQQHLIEAEDIHTQEALKSQLVIDEYKAQIARLELEKSQFESLYTDRDSEISRLEEKCEDLQEMVELRFNDVERMSAEAREYQTALSNLQQVLADFQAGQSAEVEFALAGVKKEVEIAKAKEDEWKERAQCAEARVVKMEKSVPDVDKLKADIVEKNAINRKLTFEVSQAQTHLSEAMRRMRDGTETSIDRRLVANLVVSFISSPRGDKTRYEMLNVISSVLNFTDEEKYRVGLGKKPAGYTGAGPTSPLGLVSPAMVNDDAANGSFSDLWVNYLLKSVSGDDDTTTSAPTEAQPQGMWFSSKN